MVSRTMPEYASKTSILFVANTASAGISTLIVYVGYAELPNYIVNVHEFQNLLRVIGLRNIADNFIV